MGSCHLMSARASWHTRGMRSLRAPHDPPPPVLRYMAPEVLSSAVVPASDIWSAGVMAHQLLTGRFHFDDRTNPSSPCLTKIW